jgi:hypothetical protein
MIAVVYFQLRVLYYDWLIALSLQNNTKQNKTNKQKNQQQQLVEQ